MRIESCGYKGGGGQRRERLEFGVSKCKLLNMDGLMVSYCIAQGLVFNILWSSIMEKKIKINVYICIIEPLCSESKRLAQVALAARDLAQHCKSTMFQKKSNRQTNSKCYWRYGAARNPCQLTVGWKMVCCWKKTVPVPRKLSWVTRWSSNPTSISIPQRIKNICPQKPYGFS